MLLLLLLLLLLLRSTECLPTLTAVEAASSQHFVGSDHHLMIRPMDN